MTVVSRLVLMLCPTIVSCVNLFELLTEANRQLVNITNNQSPTVEGTSVSFGCNVPQLQLEGPNSTTCMESGKWEPDPSNVGCMQNIKGY